MKKLCSGLMAIYCLYAKFVQLAVQRGTQSIMKVIRGI